MNNKQVKDIEALKKICEGEGTEFFILLNGGIRSSKFIAWFPEEKIFSITNYVDGSDQELTEKQLFDTSKTHIGEALRLGSLFSY